ncbi:N-acetylmuramoyl-L-alanine amidase [Caloramator mitchellensis]|uniref:N-acetylmuramoyl-L-alanine amidase n=1 Tax=Caloramator mitchellensis TaxID=908809 RepID=A0A0R3JY62_CALMK|nr:SH3 domain-containing protein [Caloramator mitchellensis]KRQ86068.1 N-acetylmuramoyl-L-alanine amidase [Caloramator mitchellensis]
MQKQGKFILMNRDEFKDYILKLKVNRKIFLIQNHHTYIPNYKHFKNNHFTLLKGMERSHLKRGFEEIGQNITIFPDGLIAICRPLEEAPAGIKGANSTGICIENVGNFDVGGDKMSEEQKKSIVFVNAVLCKKFKLTPSINTIVYHHWYDLATGKRTNGAGTTKSCPGTNFFGGNTVEAANKYFIPLIKKELELLNEAITQIKKGQVLAITLNLREQPSTTSKIVGTYKRDDMVQILDEKEGWYRTSKGWVCKDYVKVIG